MRCRPLYFLLIGAVAAQAAGQASRPLRTYDLLDVKWRLSFDENARSIQGEVTNTVRPLSNGLGELFFHCAKLNVLDVTVNGSPSSFRLDDDTLHVTLREPAGPGKSLQVRIIYNGKPQAGLYFVQPQRATPAKTGMVYTQGEAEDTRYWLPTYDYPDDKATSESFIEVPSSYFALGNGELVEVLQKDKKKVYHWKMAQPHVTYLNSLVAGPYVEIRETWDGIPVNSYVPPGLETQGRASFAGTADMVGFFSELTGLRYPYAKFAQIVVGDFMFGGMENITSVTNTIDTLFHPKERPFMDSSGLVLHELAHQWFGDTVTCETWGHIWINEGFASFLPHFYYRKSRGKDAYDLGRFGTLQGALDAMLSSKKPMVRDDYAIPMDMFDGNAYGGGAARMFMLMDLLGEKAFWAGIKDFLNAYKFKNANTEQFFASMSGSTGVNLDQFKLQWFYTPSAPQLTLKQSDKKLLIQQAPPYFTFQTRLWVLDGDKWSERTIAVQGEVTEVELGKDAGKPLLIDPLVFLMAKIKYDLGYTSDDWANLFRHAPNVAQKARLVHALRDENKRDLIALLAEGESNPDVLANMIEDMGAASDQLLLAWTKSPERLVQAAAVRALRRLPRNDGIVARLKEVWSKDRSDFMRQLALEGLLKLTDDEALAVEAWRSESHQDLLRAAALEWWSEKKPDAAREKCLEVVERPTSEQLRRRAIRMLGRLKDAKGENKVYDALVKLLDDPSFGGRAGAINSLKEYGDAAAIPKIAPYLDYGLWMIRNAAQGAIDALKSQPKPSG